MPFDLVIFRTMLQLPDEWEIHDRIIGATARYYKARLITKDEVLRKTLKILKRFGDWRRVARGR